LPGVCSTAAVAVDIAAALLHGEKNVGKINIRLSGNFQKFIDLVNGKNPS